MITGVPDSGIIPGTPAPAAGSNRATAMGAADFLQLLTVQLANQDPLEPMKDTAFIAQMSNFSSLEEMRGLSEAFTQFAGDQRGLGAGAYLGREVTLAADEAGGESDGAISGTVTAVRYGEAGLEVTIGDRHYPASAIRRVELAPPPAGGES